MKARKSLSDISGVLLMPQNMRLPQSLLDALKIKAQEKGIPYTRYVRWLLENDVAH